MPKSSKPARSPADETGVIEIPAPQWINLTVRIEGTLPLLIRKFSAKNIHGDTDNGPVKNKSAKQSPQSMADSGRYIAVGNGGKKLWDGFNALTIKGCMISAVGMVEKTTKTDMKLAIFVEAEGYDADGTPLIQILGERGKAGFEINKAICRTTTGASYECYRPMYQPWSAIIRLRLNAHLINAKQAVNLLSLGGAYCGIGEHRASSTKSYTGGSYGAFKIESAEAKVAA